MPLTFVLKTKKILFFFPIWVHLTQETKGKSIYNLFVILFSFWKKVQIIVI